MGATLTFARAENDLVALAQCMAIGATCFGRPSVPLPGEARAWTGLIVARQRETDHSGSPQVIGFAAFEGARGRADIAALAVVSAHRRSGVGRALLRAAIADLERANVFSVRLHVSTANHGAIALYRGEGFATVRLLRAHYQPGLFDEDGDALEMERRTS